MSKFSIEADIRSKLAMVLGFSTIAVFIQHIYVLSFILIISIAAALLFGANILKAIKTTRNLWYLFFVIVILQSIFSRSGQALLAINGFPLITAGGVLKGGEFLMRVSVIVFSATIISTSNSREVVQGLVQLKIPYDIAFMVSVAIRFLPLLRSEIKDTFTAIQLRGLDLKKIPLKRRIRVYLYIFNPVVAGAIRKARGLSIAMEMRAFRAYRKRTSFLKLRLSAADYFIMVFTLIFTSAVFVMFYYFNFPAGII